MKKLILNSLVLLTLLGCGTDVILNKESNYLEEKSSILYYKGSPLNGHLIEYYDDSLTKLKSTYSFKEGLRIGPYEIYHYSNGRLKQKGNYNTYLSYDPYQVFQDGWIEDYYDNGQLQYKRFIQGRNSTREDISYYENGQLRHKGNYSQKFLDGGSSEYVKTGLWEGYFEDGTERFKEPYDDNGNLDGDTFEFDLDEKGGKRLVSRGTYINGKLNGEHFIFTESANALFIGNFKNGFREGKCLRISHVESIDEEGNYKGITREKGSYKVINPETDPKSVEDGIWEYYDYWTGDLIQKGMYRIVDYGDGNQESVKDGWWEEYEDNILRKKTLFYKNLKKQEIEYYTRYTFGGGYYNGKGEIVRTYPSINEDNFGYVSYNQVDSWGNPSYKEERFLNGKKYSSVYLTN